MPNFSFDASQVAPDEGRIGALPAGWYPVSVDETEMKPTANGAGAYLQVRFSVLDGAHKGSKFWHRFNVQNASEKAVEIAFKQLSALLHAVKVVKMTATEQIHNIPLFVKVKVTSEAGYEPRNDITAFREINDAAAKAGFAGGAVAAAPKAVTPPPPAAPAAPAAGGWTAPATAQPWNGTSEAHQAAPSWANNIPAEKQAAPAPQKAAEPDVAPATQVNGEVLPPWMQK